MSYQSEKTGAKVDELLDKIDALENATTTEAGLMSAADKTALDSIEQKFNDGIAKTDLASSVQDSLDLADTALQSFTETDPTVPSWAKATNKPTYTASEVGALPDDTVIPEAQIQSDWSQSDNTKLDFIKNKPTIPSVTGKADKVSGATSGNFAALDSNGNLTDSGHKHSDYLTSQLYTSAYCYSGSNERYKKAYCSGFSGFRDYGYIQMIIAQGNGCNADFYISINESGSKRVYIDGVASSSTNYNLQSGSYIVYFDQNGYYFNTDGTIPKVLHTSSTSGLVKNDGTIDTNTYLTQHQDISNYVQKSSTAGLLKNDGTVDTSTYLTSAHEVPSGGNAGQILAKTSATDYDVHWTNQTITYPSAYCTTAAGTATKKAQCTLYALQTNSYVHVLIGSSNTSASALTLTINSTTAKPIYINGTASSSTNYTLPAGTYIVFYDGTNYYFRTDGKIQGLSGTLVCTNSTAGLLKNDGSIDTSTYLTSHQDISGKEDRVSVGIISGTSLSASIGTYYVGSSVGTLAVTLPTVTDATHIASVVLNIATGSSPAVTFTATTGVTISYSKDFSIDASTEYEVNCLWQGTKWIIMATEVETPS